MSPVATWLVIGPLAVVCYGSVWFAWTRLPRRRRSNVALTAGRHNNLRESR